MTFKSGDEKCSTAVVVVKLDMLMYPNPEEGTSDNVDANVDTVRKITKDVQEALREKHNNINIVVFAPVVSTSSVDDAWYERAFFFEDRQIVDNVSDEASSSSASNNGDERAGRNRRKRSSSSGSDGSDD
jgi:hypothetical protein